VYNRCRALVIISRIHYDSKAVQKRYKSGTEAVQKRYRSGTEAVQKRYKSGTNKVQIRYKYLTNNLKRHKYANKTTKTRQFDGIK